MSCIPRKNIQNEIWRLYIIWTKVKVDVSRHAIGESSSPEKYKTWIAGYFEKDGKVYDFLYIQYVGVDDSLGEKLVNNVLNNFTIQE